MVVFTGTYRNSHKKILKKKIYNIYRGYKILSKCCNCSVFNDLQLCHNVPIYGRGGAYNLRTLLSNAPHFSNYYTIS